MSSGGIESYLSFFPNVDNCEKTTRTTIWSGIWLLGVMILEGNYWCACILCIPWIAGAGILNPEFQRVSFSSMRRISSAELHTNSPPSLTLCTVLCTQNHLQLCPRYIMIPSWHPVLLSTLLAPCVHTYGLDINVAATYIDICSSKPLPMICKFGFVCPPSSSAYKLEHGIEDSNDSSESVWDHVHSKSCICCEKVQLPSHVAQS